MIYLYRKTGRKLSRVPRFLLVPRLLSLFFPLFFLSLSFNFAVPPLAVPWIVYRMHTYIERFSSWDYEYFYVDECLIVLLFGENGLGRKGIFEKHSLLLQLSSKRREKKMRIFRYGKLYTTYISAGSARKGGLVVKYVSFRTNFENVNDPLSPFASLQPLWSRVQVIYIYIYFFAFEYFQ